MPANDTQIGGDHYRKHKIQPWDAYEEWLGREGFVGNLRGNILSYLIRYKDKGGVKDLKKARHDLDKLIEVESREEEPKPCRTYPDHPTLRCACYNYGISQPSCSVHGAQTIEEMSSPATISILRCICADPPSVADPARECPVHRHPNSTNDGKERLY